jgi:hypothetical protein
MKVTSHCQTGDLANLLVDGLKSARPYCVVLETDTGLWMFSRHVAWDERHKDAHKFKSSSMDFENIQTFFLQDLWGLYTPSKAIKTKYVQFKYSNL